MVMIRNFEGSGLRPHDRAGRGVGRTLKPLTRASRLGGNKALACRLTEQRYDLGDADHLAQPRDVRFRNLSCRAATKGIGG